jgi:hypothetical protein
MNYDARGRSLEDMRLIWGAGGGGACCSLQPHCREHLTHSGGSLAVRSSCNSAPADGSTVVEEHVRHLLG